jgi:hypothetical protein
MTAREVIAHAILDNPGGGIGAQADAILAALAGAGFAVVPVEPSEHMVDEGSLHTGGLLGKAWLTYRAMLAAAQPAREGGE